MSTTYDKIDYVKWAQRSLNRIMGRSVPVDGKEFGPWRGALGDFKDYLKINEPGLDKFQIGAKTQNDLIRLSHLSPTYLQWLHAKLPGAGHWEGADGASRLQKSIRAFQAKNPPLKQDGWIGAKTETALIAVYGEPPGNGGPPPAPAPEWLQVWNALPIQMRYATWIVDMAARVGANKAKDGGRPVPKGGWDPVYQHLLGILAKNAKARPKLVHFYFTDTDVGQIKMAKLPRVDGHRPKKAPGGGMLVDEQALRTIALHMTSTQDLFKLTMGMVMTPQAYASAQQMFEERVFQTYKAIESGFMGLVQLGSTRGGILGGEYDSKYDYMLIVIATLSLSEDSVYSAFRHNLPNPASWEAPKALAALLGLN